jgi:hypothetical protein
MLTTSLMKTGAINQAQMAHGQAEALKGLSMLRAVVVPAGQVIYRFYDSQRALTPAQGAEGEWWFEFEHFQAIKHFGLRHGHSMSYAARLFAAILYEWSDVNAYVACRTRAALACWKGRGKQVRSQGKDVRDLPTMTPMQSVLEVYQLFIPGMKAPGSIADRAVEVHAHGSL